MSNQVREPQQERSIEKKNKIIEAAYELFSEVGYYGTNTAEIAKRAGVSTGIVYGYFQDKRDIMIRVLGIYIDAVYTPVAEILRSVADLSHIEETVSRVVDAVIAAHEKNEKLHNTLHSLAASDETVNARFIALEDDITSNLSGLLVRIGLKEEGIKEKVHLAMNIMQSFSHEYVFDKHPYIDYDYMRSAVCRIITKMFEV